MGACGFRRRMKTVFILNEEVKFSSFKQNSNKAKIPVKQPKGESKALIISALSKHYLFKGLGDTELDVLFAQMKYWFACPLSTIFEQGTPGKFFYIVESGLLEVCRNGVVKTFINPGETFGENSLLTSATRSATIKTVKETELWGITRSKFLAAIKAKNFKNFVANKKFMNDVPVFSAFDQKLKDSLIECLVEHNYTHNTRIVCEGDKGLLLFIVKKGNAVAKLKGEEKFRIGEGDIFGEDILLSDNLIRNLSVYADGELTAFSISRDSLIDLLGENYKSLIYISQAKLCFNSNPITKMLPKNDQLKILETIEWINYKPEEVAIEPGSLNDSICLLCLGNLHSKSKQYSKYEIIGLEDKQFNNNEKIFAKSEVLLGKLLKADVERICKKSWNELKFEIKNMHFLKKFRLFSKFKLEDLITVVSMSTIKNYDIGEVVYEFDDDALDIYVVKRGSIEIIEFGRIIRVVENGDIFGEQCILNSKRNHVAKVASPAITIKIPLVAYNSFAPPISLTIKKILGTFTDFSLSQVSFIKPLPPKPPRLYYLACTSSSDTLMRVTVIKKEYFNDMEKITKILLEKSLLLKINSEFIFKFLKSFNDNKFVYFLHEQCESVPLSSIYKKNTSEDFIKQVSACLLLFLQSFHDKDIFFRDICLSNISIKNSGFLVLNDLKHCKVSKFRTSTFIGDPLYMAPEMLKKQGYTKSVDLWALGILIYQLLYHNLPFGISKKDNPMEIYQKITSGTIEIPSGTIEIPPGTRFIRGSEVVGSLLQLDFQKRLTLTELKKHRWLDSIHWENLEDLSIQPAFKPEIPKSRPRSQKLIPIQDYLNVKYIQENIEIDKDSSRKVFNFNWDRNF